MADETTNQTAPTAVAEAPKSVIKVININNKPQKFEQQTVARGENKGKPVLLPKFAGNDPDANEAITVLASWGDKPLLHKFHQIIRKVAAVASVEAAVKGPDGRYEIDSGKFATALLKEVADLLSADKAELEEALQKTQDELNEVFTKILKEYVAVNKPVPQELSNRCLVINTKFAELQAKLKGKSRAKKKEAAAASA